MGSVEPLNYQIPLVYRFDTRFVVLFFSVYRFFKRNIFQEHYPIGLLGLKKNHENLIRHAPPAVAFQGLAVTSSKTMGGGCKHPIEIAAYFHKENAGNMLGK